MRERSPQRSTTFQPDRPSRLKLAGFVWVAGLAFLAYLGVAIASGRQQGGPTLFGQLRAAGGPRRHFRSPAVPVLGRASWYGSQFHGLETASGVPFDMNALTAAHRTLPSRHPRPWCTTWRTAARWWSRSTIAAPNIAGRDIDLSYGAARALGMVAPGVVKVEIRPL